MMLHLLLPAVLLPATLSGELTRGSRPSSAKCSSESYWDRKF